MKIARYFVLGVVAALSLTAPSYGLNIVVLAKVSDLQTATSSYAPDTQISIGGYYNDADQGGGLFVAGAAGSCQAASFSGSTTAGSTTIPYSGLTGTIADGMSINGPPLSMYLPAGDTIVSHTGSSVTLAFAAASSSGTVAFTLNSDNGGSQLCDSNTSPGPTLYTRIHSNFGPKEWGAHGDGTSDDTVRLYNWLNHAQPHIGDVGNYEVTSPLACPANQTIQGPANLSVSVGTPPFRIFANGSTFPVNEPLLTLNDYCRITGIALDAQGRSGVDTVDVNGTHVVIDGHSLVENAGQYNIFCGGGSGGQAGLQIKDSQIIMGAGGNIHSICPNLRVTGNIISGAGASGTAPVDDLYFNGSDAIIANNAIEQSLGNGLNINKADQVKVIGNYFDSNGKCQYVANTCDANTIAGLRIFGSEYVTVTGNSFHRSDLGFTGGEHVLFDNAHVGNYGNVFSANTYFPDAGSDGAAHPDYVYGVNTSDSVSMVNTRLYERPGKQGTGIYGPSAQAILAGLVSPIIWQNYITGLTLSRPSTKQVTIDVGEASDSTNTALIKADATCTVDFNNSDGDKALDAGTFTAGVTYFFYLISTAEGANPSCIASASVSGPTLPSFPASALTASVDTTTGSSTISLHSGSWPAGIVQGQTISGSGIPSSPPTTIVDVNATSVTMSAPATATATITASFQGAYSLFRLVGALYAVSGPQIVDFVQDGDTFYLNTPVVDMNTGNTGGNLCNNGTLGTSAVSCPLSVPCGNAANPCPSPGLKVMAFGRIAGGTNKVLISTLDSTPGAPTGFPGTPGYSVTSTGPNSAFPFHVFTDVNGNVRVRAAASGTNVYEDTEGWVWHRGR